MQMHSEVENNSKLFCHLNILFYGLYQPRNIIIITLSTSILQVTNINYLNNLTKDKIYIFSDFQTIQG